MTKNNIRELSIQVHLSGLSFCIYNRSTNTVEHLQSKEFDKKQTPLDVLDALKAELSSNIVFSDTFETVTIIYQNELSNLVPKELFDENNSADYLKFSSKILQSDYVTFDEIAINNTCNVYVPYVNINNYIFETFGEFTFKHSSTILIDTILQKETNSKDKKVYINVNKSHLEILTIDKGNLLIYNSFDYFTPEDFIYFVLFTLEQLQLDTETIPIKLLGTISEQDDVYKILYKYIRFIDFESATHSFKFSEDQKPEYNHQNFILLNSF